MFVIWECVFVADKESNDDGAVDARDDDDVDADDARHAAATSTTATNTYSLMNVCVLSTV